MNILTVKNAIVSMLISACLTFCLFQAPNYPPLDQSYSIDKPHVQEIAEIELYGESPENNLMLMHERRRIVEKRLIS